MLPIMSDAPATVVPIAGSLGLRDATRLAAEFAVHVGAPGPLVFDCGSLAEADLAGVQLLVSAGCSAAAAGKQLTVAAPLGTPLAELLAAAGFVPPDIPSVTGIWTITEARAA
jgi:hypothetical protein